MPGTIMNLTLPQWIACFVLDLLIKSFLVTAFGILVTLSAVPVSVFLNLAISLSMLHFICVFLGVTVALRHRDQLGSSTHTAGYRPESCERGKVLRWHIGNMRF